MRRAIATLSLTIAALTFVLRFTTEAGVTFAAGTVPLASGPTDPAAATSTSSTSATADPVPSTATANTSTTVGGSTTTTTAADQVIDGPVIRTQWGDVQVEVTLSGGRLADVTALLFPDHTSLSRQINDYVLPRYREAALNSQSARFVGISGATVTWWGYVNSLQAALDSVGA